MKIEPQAMYTYWMKSKKKNVVWNKTWEQYPYHVFSKGKNKLKGSIPFPFFVEGGEVADKGRIVGTMKVVGRGSIKID
jgi:hypothetical protein